MNPIDQFKTKPFGAGANTEQWPGIDSAFRLIVIAGLRSKRWFAEQLHGSSFIRKAKEYQYCA